MSELVWFLVPVCAALWMAGGTWWKPLRRYGYSLVLAGGLIWAGGFRWVVVLMGAGITLTAHLGYGDGADWLKRFSVGSCYALSLVPLVGSLDAAASILILSSAVLFVVSLWLSRKLDRKFPHKMCELIHGGYFATAAVWLAAR